MVMFLYPLSQTKISQFNSESLRGSQEQMTTIILDCLDGLDSETFHNDIFFTTVTAAVTEILLYYK